MSIPKLSIPKLMDRSAIGACEIGKVALGGGSFTGAGISKGIFDVLEFTAKKVDKARGINKAGNYNPFNVLETLEVIIRNCFKKSK